MAGRGFSLNNFKKKEDDASSNAPSETSASLFLNTMGRGTGGTGRGLFPPSIKPADPAPSLTMSSIGTGRGVIMGGRGMFAVKPPAPKVTPQSTISNGSSDPVTGLSSTTKKDNSNSSGIIAGRGFSTSGRGTGSGRGSGSGLSQPKMTDSPAETYVEEAVVAQPTIPIPAVQPPDIPPPIKKKYNTKSKEMGSMVNLIEIHFKSNSGIYEYFVEFSPPVDNLSFRSKYLGQHRDFLGNAKTFDGVILFLPNCLPDEVTKLTCKNMVEGGEDVEIKITYKRQRSRVECVQFYNILFDRIFRILNYLRVGRKSFDPTAPQLIPQHKLEIWPGYVKAVDLHENDRLLLTLDVSHRVLSTRSVLDVMKECLQNNRERFRDDIKKCLIGSIVLTRYNNKTYRVDDILFDETPRSTFTRQSGEVSYIDYYKQQYNLTIQDEKQFMMMSRGEVRISGEKEKREFIVMLVPELCNMTGLTENQRKNFTVMKDLATFTKLSPLKRMDAYKKFLSNVNNTPLAKSVLDDWGLSLDNEPLHLTARLLNDETILFGRNKEIPAGPQADFSKGITTNQVLEPIDVVNWLLVYFHKDKKEANGLVEWLMKVCPSTGMRVSQPKMIELQNDRTESYVSAIRKELNDAKIQIVVCIFPSLRDDRYAAVKKILCAEIPVPSQCINAKTLRNDAKNRSIVLKILLQMNCKLGGTLWGIKIPLKETMICGIDTYHETGHKGITVGGLVASLNPQFTRWWSRPTIQEKREELVNGLTSTMEAALRAFKKFNNSLPDRIVLYRDGVGDGQLTFVEKYEIPQFKAAFERIDPKYKPKLTFVVVQKRINTKFFLETGRGGKDLLQNPPPGAVLDHTVTSRGMYDFYMISQHVREGATTPSHYIVLEDGSSFEPEILQRITYKLCYLYYNWPGTVRVPAPCQYAHKLADLVGLNIKRQTAEQLAEKLYYL